MAEFLTELSQRGINIWAEGDQLHYRAAKDALTPPLREELRQHKEAILTFLKNKNSRPAPTPSSPLSSTHEGPLPLSFAQERLWFLQQLEPESEAYVEPNAVRLFGHMTVEALEQSLKQIVQRHETLRTTFVSMQGIPRQVIAPRLHLPLPVIDLLDLPADQCTAEMYRLLDEASHVSFDLSRGPLVQFFLLRLAQTEHILLTTQHHIISDRVSGNVFYREIIQFYQACSNTTNHDLLSSLPQLSIQYADYALWQREWLQGEVLEKHLDYWSQQLAGAPPLLELPTDFPRPARASYRGAQYFFDFPMDLLQSLTTLSAQEGVTLFMTLLAACQTLLMRYSGQTDLVVGTPVAGRNRVEHETLIGLFINTLVLRTDLSGNPTFRSLLKRVRSVCLDAYEHQDLPFEKLVEALQPQRSLSYSPFFQTLFVLDHTQPTPVGVADLKLQAVEWSGTSAKFDISITLLEARTRFRGAVEYSTDLFTHDTIVRLVSHFQTLLESIVAHPEQRLWELPLLSPVEEAMLRYAWNQPQFPSTEQHCLPDLFEAQVAQTPEAIALAFEDQQLTYAELNARANMLAQALQHLGVGPERLVGVCLERSAEMVIALLGILKAGGAYVPLDPAYPAERLAFMAQDARLSVLLTQQSLLDQVPTGNWPTLCLDTEWEQMAQAAPETPARAVAASNLAYVLYTSGSTGTPKGVQISHAALLNFLSSMRQRPGLSRQDILLAVTSLSFDIAGLELYLPLLAGACLEVASRQATQDGALLADYLARCGATVLQATPATWRMLLAADWQPAPQMRILCGGEALPATLAASLQANDAQVWNLYGPTETTIWSSVQRVVEGHKADGPVPLGQPITQTQFYVLDPYGHLAPLGVPGELYIGGIGLARGYLRRPDLTAGRFLPDPFSEVPGARMYRTGDRVRWRAEGTLEYLGRSDFQVKLRGYRIELGEIESVLEQQPGVAQAVVVLRTDISTDQRLVAYIVPEPDRVPPNATELRQGLQAHLPEYMLPAAYVLLEHLPLTPNGKLNRRALPAPEWTAQLEAGYLAPRTPVEKQLASLWARVLGIEQVGINDNFFALGGHSLLATQLLAHIHNTFQARLPLRALFEAPTIAIFAPLLEQPNQRQAPEEHQVAIPLARGARYGGLARRTTS
ncbi:MAG TPA: amino acid adenylation domain-containing protein [Ktedonobacterales bacterium]|nr:amino acid adenylation domain-containing protein [Ktedonobacterales bacterium]